MNRPGDDNDHLEHLAKELHDDAGQTLTAVKFKIQAVISDTGTASPQTLKASLEEAVSLLQDAIEEVRNVQARLRELAQK